MIKTEIIRTFGQIWQKKTVNAMKWGSEWWNEMGCCVRTQGFFIAIVLLWVDGKWQSYKIELTFEKEHLHSKFVM